MESENSTPSLSRASSMDVDEWSIFHDSTTESERPSFRVLTSNDVVSQMNAEIKLIIESLHLPPTIVRILFDRYKWDNQVLMEKYTACACDNDKEAFFRDARIINPLKYKAYTQPVTTATCEICYDTKAVTGLQCGHKFCDSCWCMYLTVRINDGGESIIPCAHSKCDIILEDVTVKTLVTDPNVISKYNRLICNSFVQWKKNLHWCPSPGCIYIIDVQSYDCKYVTCLCKNQFCCECLSEWHAPISCKLLETWKTDDSATQDYFTSNTKMCPKCEWSIEKNGGCPHMTCKHCRHEFCWKCLKPWAKHDGSYKCKSPEETEAIQKSRTSVERMNNCWERYSYNRHALKEELDRYNNLNWQEMELHLSDIKRRVQILYECRRFLMHSYAFIFYLEEDNRVYLLESNLDDLEAKTDKLSTSLELFFYPEEDEEPRPNKDLLRAKISDNAVHCERLQKKWLSYIEKKCEEDSWQYRDRCKE